MTTGCDWCGVEPATHDGECDRCWRLPGHEGENAEPEYVVALRNDLAAAREQVARLRAALEPFARTWDRYVTTGSKMIGLRNETLDFDKWFWLTKEHERAARDYAEAAAALAGDEGEGGA